MTAAFIITALDQEAALPYFSKWGIVSSAVFALVTGRCIGIH